MMASSNDKAGKTKVIRREGLTGVFQTLCEEHAQISALLQSVPDNPAQRAELWQTIRAQLLSHERGEVRELYPVLRSKDATRGLADQHDVEAKEMEDMVLDLDLLPVASDAWVALFAQLATAVLEHAEEEETEMFPQAQAVLGEALTVELDGKFLEAKAKLVMAV